MSLLQRLFTPKPDPRESLRPLWHAIVAEARRPAWYADDGVADTVAGRFDMVSAVLAVVLVRMEDAGTMTDETVLLTELFVHDMDGQLREFGVGDVVVGKHVGKLVGAMGGRLGAYRAGLAGDQAALETAVGRNVSFREGGDPARVARRLRALSDRLAALPDDQLLAGDLAA
ncbi:hypothetical protein N0B51_00255 [Tsuneonella sp. YG55]|uniref:Ubiquinol-cytochrome c chaperone domain-containing protein n=1 Tax=Tsuneonella litorea TaxID=2976475 RepID=A0A9X3A6J9_9SPHN|nr:ubiquinol-cytochrome C chaperone family protein [Tsuneonella litorea]MCT2557401.1 hypothetical protein [Tsuneonella litorea]